MKPHLQIAEVGDLLEGMGDAVMALAAESMAAASGAEMLPVLKAQTALRQLPPPTGHHQKLPQLHHKLCSQNGSLQSEL